jgi:hypothetical protein
VNFVFVSLIVKRLKPVGSRRQTPAIKFLSMGGRG